MKKITLEELEEMKNINIETVNPDELVDIKDIKIDETKSKDEKIYEFINQIKNPYCFKCGKMIIKVGFEETDITFEDRIQNYLKSL